VLQNRDPSSLIVMPGLDPGIHRNKAAGESPPFLFERQSIVGCEGALGAAPTITIPPRDGGHAELFIGRPGSFDRHAIFPASS
jgi:hypothetical protein